MRITRLGDGPIIRPNMDGRMGENVNGPSLIRVPDWVANPLARYYLYFADHAGSYIRLAYADDLSGPWRTHEPGVLPMEKAGFHGHVASPDVHVDDDLRELRLYFHGMDRPRDDGTGQSTRVALSNHGLSFEVLPEVLGPQYFRVFRRDGYWCALVMPGVVYRSRDGLGRFEEGPMLFTPRMRHSAVRLVGDTLQVFYSDVGDCPERILLATVDVRGDWREWRASAPRTVLEPERDYEGAGIPPEPSVRGPANEPVCQLRDPAIFEEDGTTYLLYSVAGERGIALAQVDDG
jgi:hypothetical protein